MLSLEIFQNKLKLFRHVLRSHLKTPAQKAMNNYFKKRNSKKYSERPIMTLPKSLHNDMKDKTFQNKYKIHQLKPIHDLESLRLLEQERQSWLTLVNDIYAAAKAEKNSKFFNAK